jgi:hypothetical protein
MRANHERFTSICERVAQAKATADCPGDVVLAVVDVDWLLARVRQLKEVVEFAGQTNPWARSALRQDPLEAETARKQKVTT